MRVNNDIPVLLQSSIKDGILLNWKAKCVSTLFEEHTTSMLDIQSLSPFKKLFHAIHTNNNSVIIKEPEGLNDTVYVCSYVFITLYHITNYSSDGLMLLTNRSLTST